jgi:hypothetical protein
MVLSGGASGILVDIIQALLEMKNIMFLPKTSIVVDQTKYNNYFASVDSKTLLYLVKTYDVGNLESMQKMFGGPVRENPPQIDDQGDKLIQNLNLIKPDLNNMHDARYYDKYLQLNNKLQGLEGEIKGLKGEIDDANLQLQNFQCIPGLDDEKNEFLSNFILDCSVYCNRDTDWYKVLLNIDSLDKDYEVEVLKMVNKNGLQLDYDSIRDICNKLIENTELKDIFKNRLIECSKAPYSFLDTLTGNISFDSLNDCQKCHDDCILYLNDSYKSFLMNESDGIGISNKLKVLLYCEFRLYTLSKYITLEALRIKKQNYSRVKNILKKLSVDEKKRIVQKNVVEKKRAEDILKMKKLEAIQSSQKKEIDILVDKKQKSMHRSSRQRGGSHHVGGADMNDNLMKQNLLSQVLQIIANDSNLNVPDIQNKLNMINGQPMVNKPGIPNKPIGEQPSQPGMPKPQGMAKPQGMPPNKPQGMTPDKPIDSTDTDSTDMPKRPLDMPPIKNIVNRPDVNKPIVDELIPNCTAIAQDVMDGKINEKNFIYLSPKCDTQIMNALKSSR